MTWMATVRYLFWVVRVQVQPFYQIVLALWLDVVSTLVCYPPPRLMHLVGASTCVTTQQKIMLCIRDIFWQSFWRDEFFRKRKLGFFLEGRVGFRQLLGRPSLDGLVFCYKEPFLCFAVQQFAVHFPNSRFIHIIRDGRDNADSMCRTYGDALSDEVLSSDCLSVNKVSEIGFWRRIKNFNYPYWIRDDECAEFRRMSHYGRYIRLWREMTERAMALSGFVSADRYLEVRYESIVKDPIKEGWRIKEFLGLKSRRSYETVLKRAFSGSIGISKRNQSAEKLAEATAIAGPLLASLGYQ